MRWPWQSRKPDPVADEMAAHMEEHQSTLKRVRFALRGASDEIGRAAQLIEDYERADRERRL